MVCPTCYCYDVVDDVELARAGTRTRFWDSCLFTSHALIGSGENFRHSRASASSFASITSSGLWPNMAGRAASVAAVYFRLPVNIDVVQVLESLRRVEHVASR